MGQDTRQSGRRDSAPHCSVACFRVFRGFRGFRGFFFSFLIPFRVFSRISRLNNEEDVSRSLSTAFSALASGSRQKRRAEPREVLLDIDDRDVHFLMEHGLFIIHKIK
jgi:hypothetical protein